MRQSYMRSMGPVNILITGEAADEVRDLGRELGLSSESDVVTHALRFLRDGVDAEVVTKDKLGSLENKLDYDLSYIPAFRLYNVVRSMAPNQDLRHVKKIIVDTRQGSRAVDWETDFATQSELMQ